MGIVKTAILGFLILSPCVFTFTLPETKSEVEARQFHDEPLINYGIWGFIAGLSDYFIRNGVNTMATATTTTTTTRTRSTRRKRETRGSKTESLRLLRWRWKLLMLLLKRLLRPKCSMDENQIAMNLEQLPRNFT